MKYPKSVIEMLNELGDPYEIKNIDCEPCLYRNLKNGFDVEICGVYSRRRKENRRVFICLWWIGIRQNKTNSGAQIIMHVSGIPCDANAIHTVTEMLYAYSNQLLADGRCIDDRIKISPGRIDYDELIARGNFQEESKCHQKI